MRSPPSAARSFDLVRHHRANGSIFLYAFDLIEVNGDDLRHDPLEGRKATLQIRPGPASGSTSTWKATARPCFGTPASWASKAFVSKRRDSAYRSGRSPDWLKMKNSDAPAVKREEEEEWGKTK